MVGSIPELRQLGRIRGECFDILVCRRLILPERLEKRRHASEKPLRACIADNLEPCLKEFLAGDLGIGPVTLRKVRAFSVFQGRFAEQAPQKGEIAVEVGETGHSGSEQTPRIEEGDNCRAARFQNTNHLAQCLTSIRPLGHVI